MHQYISFNIYIYITFWPLLYLTLALLSMFISHIISMKLPSTFNITIFPVIIWRVNMLQAHQRLQHIILHICPLSIWLTILRVTQLVLEYFLHRSNIVSTYSYLHIFSLLWFHCFLIYYIYCIHHLSFVRTRQ